MAISEQVSLDESIPSADAESELETAVREHGRFVFQVTYSLLRNHFDAEDATQETFLRLWRNRKRWGDIHDQRAWLARTAWRVALSRKREVPEIAIDEAVASILDLKSHGAGPDEIAAHEQMKSLLGRLIAGLPPDLRHALILSSVKEMTAAEVSQALDLSPASVRARLFRARELLREKLAALLEQKHGR